jgi:hypothetical protein
MSDTSFPPHLFSLFPFPFSFPLFSFFFSFFFFFLFFFFLFCSDSLRQPIVVGDRTRIGKITLTGEILGRGSLGTIIYKGRYEGKEIAVKRMQVREKKNKKK